MLKVTANQLIDLGKFRAVLICIESGLGKTKAVRQITDIHKE